MPSTSDGRASADMPSQVALANLIEMLESDDYRTVAGVNARHTAAFAEAKALLTLRDTLDRKPWWRQ
jgi:hypothetical protein